ncbi:NUDIX domain-containing protein [soil metagenome]
MEDFNTIYVEVYIFKKIENKILYLILKRKNSRKVYPGIWQVVTGKREKGEKIYLSAMRECKEETDLNQKKFYSLPMTTSFYSPDDDKIHIIPLFLAEVHSEESVKLSEEHEEFKWCDLEEAVSLLFWESQQSNLKKIEMFLSDEKLLKNLKKV